MSNCALIRVDIQNDFIKNTRVSVKNGNSIIECVNALTNNNYFSQVIDIRDCHTPNNSSFKKWGIHCIENTIGCMPPENLIQKDSIKLFTKGHDDHTDALSAFENKDFNLYLLKNRIKKLFITGIATEYCVLATAKDSAANGFETFIILDACAGFNENINNDPEFLDLLKRLNIQAIYSKNIPKS